MSRRLQERHSRLREAEVFLEDVPRARLVPGGARVAEPLLRRDVEPRASRPSTGCSTARPTWCASGCSCRTTRTLGARAHGQPARELRVRDAAPRLRRDRLLDLVRERLPARAADAAAGGHPAARARPRPARPARDPGRRGDVPEPRAARALRRRHRRGRGRGARAAHDGGAPRRRRTRAGPRVAPAEGRLLHPDALRGPLPRGRHRRGLRRPGAHHAPARLAGRHGLPAVGDPHPEHRDVDEVHGRDLARLPVHVPLLLGRLQLPAGARLHPRRARGARARGARRSRTRSASSRPRSATTPRSTASWTTSRAWTTRSRSPRCGSTT